jgi:hypothetical protein
MERHLTSTAKPEASSEADEFMLILRRHIRGRYILHVCGFIDPTDLASFILVRQMLLVRCASYPVKVIRCVGYWHCRSSGRPHSR